LPLGWQKTQRRKVELLSRQPRGVKARLAHGGVIGMLLSLGVLKFIGKLITSTTVMSLDLEMILAAIFLSLVAGLIAGLYPAWRICTLQPAVQLKV